MNGHTVFIPVEAVAAINLTLYEIWSLIEGAWLVLILCSADWPKCQCVAHGSA